VDRRSFLFLQGPHGTFFYRLGQALAAKGQVVHRVNLNGGDRRDWPGEATDFRGRFGEWALFVDRFLDENGVTDLVLFGDCRPYHAAAHGMASLRGVRVHVLEEGYLRPDYMTLEEGGVNGHSRLSRDPDWWRGAAEALSPADADPFVPSSFDYRRRQTVRHAAAMLGQAWRFPHYRPHRPAAAPVEALGWALRWAGRGRAGGLTERATRALGDRPYFLLPLQLDGDYQLRTHSPFSGMAEALHYVVRSFAARAPQEARLVVKRHPLDGGLTDWNASVARAAGRYGVGERVHYMPGRDTAQLVEGAAGVVTVNSTVGTLALRGGKPVCVLGDAVYAVPGLVHGGRLDDFWTSPAAPDPALFDAFRRVLLDRVLIAGGYGSDAGVEMLVDGAVRRLT